MVDGEDQEEEPTGWRTIEPWEVAVLLATLLAIAAIWCIFLLVHGARLWPIG
ncbi:MAG TPA: hypothetical protein VFX49_18955 [Chloroflexota bacterium]|nr:hypothetical protein [Chloroflexota bacterium]